MGPHMRIDREADKFLELMGRDRLIADGAPQQGVNKPDRPSMGAAYVQDWLRRDTEARIASGRA
jgi:hypothetical protein